MLLDRGADKTIKNSDNETPLDIATRLGNHVIIGILQAHSQPIPGPSNQQASIGQSSAQRKRTRTDSDENTPEDSNSKKQRISSQATAQVSRGVKRPHDAEEVSQPKKQKTDQDYPKGTPTMD